MTHSQSSPEKTLSQSSRCKCMNPLKIDAILDVKTMNIVWNIVAFLIHYLYWSRVLSSRSNRVQSACSSPTRVYLSTCRSHSLVAPTLFWPSMQERTSNKATKGKNARGFGGGTSQNSAWTVYSAIKRQKRRMAALWPHLWCSLPVLIVIETAEGTTREKDTPQAHHVLALPETETGRRR